MNLLELKISLGKVSKLLFASKMGMLVPFNFHITEVGLLTKSFFDCGGKLRCNKYLSFQIWINDNDVDHRMTPSKFLEIIEKVGKDLPLGDSLEIEVEYMDFNTLGKYSLEFSDDIFILNPKFSECLAPDICGKPELVTLG